MNAPETTTIVDWYAAAALHGLASRWVFECASYPGTIPSFFATGSIDDRIDQLAKVCLKIGKACAKEAAR